MGRTGWIAGALLFGVLTGSADVAAGTSEQLTIHVLVLDEVGIPASTLHYAQDEASRLFERAGITLSWLPAQAPPPDSMVIKLVVKIVANSIGDKAKNRNVLGIAPGSKEVRGKVAWLFYPRIDDLGQTLNLEVSQLLGHVMAHEMGHLLLPYGGHAVTGLMKAGWDTKQALLASTGSLTFEPSQAALIRARLRETSSGN